MELNFFELFFQIFDWKLLAICALGTTIIVSAINIFTPDNIKGKYILLVVSIVVVFLNTTFVPAAKFADWQQVGFQFLVNVGGAMVIYWALGKWTVELLLIKLKKILGDKFGKDDL